ncbi:MAG: hypothetical protein WCL23_05785 [Candidatus Moraniibacteriota bacterium]
MKRPCLITFILACLILTTPLFARAATTDKSIRWERTQDIQEIRHIIDEKPYLIHAGGRSSEVYRYRGCYILVPKNGIGLRFVVFSDKKYSDGTVGLQFFVIVKQDPVKKAEKIDIPLPEDEGSIVRPATTDIFREEYRNAAKYLPKKIQVQFYGIYDIGKAR